MWQITYHECLAIVNLHREITLALRENYELKVHHNFTKSTIDHQEATIQNIISRIKAHTNPFLEGPEALQNIITQKLADTDSSFILLNVFKSACNIFIF